MKISFNPSPFGFCDTESCKKWKKELKTSVKSVSLVPLSFESYVYVTKQEKHLCST